MQCKSCVFLKYMCSCTCTIQSIHVDHVIVERLVTLYYDIAHERRVEQEMQAGMVVCETGLTNLV